MALNENVIKAAREHIRRNDNPGEVANFNFGFYDNLTGKRSENAQHEELNDYEFTCTSAASAVIAALIFAHYNNGSCINTNWSQESKKFFMNKTTRLIAQRTKDAFDRHKDGFNSAMFEYLQTLISRNL